MRTARVKGGSVERILRVSGITGAKRAFTLVAPKLARSRSGPSSGFTLTLTRVARPGALVQSGQLVAEFDQQYMRQHLDDHRAEVEQQRRNMQKMRAQVDIKRKALEQRLLRAQADLEKARLNLKTIPVRSSIQAAHFRLAADEAEQYQRQLSKEIALADISEGAALRRVELQLELEELDMRKAVTSLSRMSLTAPIDGIVVMGQTRRGTEMAEIEEGDELRAGHGFLSILDLRSLIVDAEVNQTDAQLLRLGMLARVRFDGVEKLVLAGRLTAIGGYAQAGRGRPSYVRQIPIRLTLDQTDPRVFPNSTASADLVMGAEMSGTVLPRECIRTSGPGGEPHCYVYSGAAWEKRQLQLGLQSNTEVVVRSGLQEGDLVAAEDPFAR
ncbi:MAG: HlyD family efflux transporter periplasmic adaptor subunit [Acidobacteriia bacterium]|nr:HlyD family efflux transporter periplasmic adaptor subunit [Terriglobia bacterium]